MEAGVDIQSLPNTGTSNNRIATEVLFWIGIFLMIIAKSLHNYLQTNASFNSDPQALLQRDVFLPLLVSQIVFGGTYGMIDRTRQKNLGTLIFAFQNGFFWKAIFGQPETMYQQ